MALKLTILTKCLFMVVLLGLFVSLFGYESLKKYIKADITIIESVEENEVGNEIPAVTICADINGEYGWKNAVMDESTNVMNRICNTENVEQIYRCIEEKTYTLDEVVNSNLEFSIPKDLWTSSLTNAAFGVCHTYLESDRVGIDK